jgi:hypothetical protein
MRKKAMEGFSLDSTTSEEGKAKERRLCGTTCTSCRRLVGCQWLKCRKAWKRVKKERMATLEGVILPVETAHPVCLSTSRFMVMLLCHHQKV